MMDPGGMGRITGQSSPVWWPGMVVAISWVLVAVGIVLLLIWAARRFRERGASASVETPLAILQRRYARGEIGSEEYERIRSDLLRNGGDQ